ncbi:MAG TPA: hypothetical protein VI094_16850 [Propionibacteriaceae bacterium]
MANQASHVGLGIRHRQVDRGVRQNRRGVGLPCRESLDANDPWGSTVQLNEDEWPEQLTANLDAISAAWCQQDTWQGTIHGTVMPARSLGEMALIEIMLHGWDVAPCHRSAG